MSRSGRSEDRARVVAARAVHRSRNAQQSLGDSAYVVYISVLVAAIVGVPVVRTIALGLATPAAMEAAADAATGSVVAVLGALVWLGALALGRVRGPIAPQPFAASVLARSSIHPTIAWARDLASSSAAVLLVLGGVAALSVSGFLVNGVNAAMCLAFIAGALLFALPTVAIWLAGQVLSRGAATILGTGILALLLAAVIAPTTAPLLPANALAALWPGSDGPTTTPLVVLGAVAIAAASALPALLARMTPMSVEQHAQRWETMTLLTATGDISGALDRARAHPATGRRLRIAFHRPLLLAVLQRATIGAARTPLRTATAVSALAGAGIGWAWIAEQQDGPRWVLAVAAGVLMFAALGAFSDGFREAADTAGRPALYGLTPGRMLLLQVPLPLLMGIVVPTAFAVLAGAGPGTAALVATLGAVAVAIRAYNSTKGSLPIELMMPVPTPVGDASTIGVWAWQADALLWAGFLSFWLWEVSATAPLALLWAVPVVLALAALTMRRLRRAAS